MIGKRAGGVLTAVALCLFGAYHLVDGLLWSLGSASAEAVIMSVDCDSHKDRDRERSTRGRITRSWNCDTTLRFQDQGGTSHTASLNLHDEKSSAQRGDELSITYQVDDPTRVRKYSYLPWFLPGLLSFMLAYGAFLGSRGQE